MYSALLVTVRGELEEEGHPPIYFRRPLAMVLIWRMPWRSWCSWSLACCSCCWRLLFVSSRSATFILYACCSCSFCFFSSSFCAVSFLFSTSNLEIRILSLMSSPAEAEGDVTVATGAFSLASSAGKLSFWIEPSRWRWRFSRLQETKWMRDILNR